VDARRDAGHGRYHSLRIDLRAMAQSWSNWSRSCFTPIERQARRHPQPDGRGLALPAIPRIGQPCLRLCSGYGESVILASLAGNTRAPASARPLSDELLLGCLDRQTRLIARKLAN